MRIIPNNIFYVKLLPTLKSALSDTKAEVEKQISEYTTREHNAPPRILTQAEHEKLVNLTNFLTELEHTEYRIKALFY
jgi:hypothetical protein